MIILAFASSDRNVSPTPIARSLFYSWFSKSFNLRKPEETKDRDRGDGDVNQSDRLASPISDRCRSHGSDRPE